MKHLALSALLSCIGVTQAFAQFPTNGAAVCLELGHQEGPAQVISDSSGGAIVSWQDSRSGAYDIYAQRLAPDGDPLWARNGVVVCSSPGTQQTPVLVADGSGGAVIVWVDFRNGTADIYGQRISPTGSPMWTPGGVSLCSAGGEQNLPRIASDGAGGALVTWHDARTGAYDIYAQRISSGGLTQWTLDGVPVCITGNTQLNPVIVTDASNGATVVWQDLRGGSTYDIYAQRLSPTGVALWNPNGLPFCTASGNQQSPLAIPDGSGGTILAWQDARNGQNHLYTQRVNPIGVGLWANDGVVICNSPNGITNPTMTSNNNGGAILAWDDPRNGGSNYDIYAQQIGAAGLPLWPGNGIPVCSVALNQQTPSICPNGLGGAIVAWNDFRFGNWDIYAQNISSVGALEWSLEGVILSAGVGYQTLPVMVSDAQGGAIVGWREERYWGTTGADVFAQHVDAAGVPLFPDAEYPHLVGVRDVANDQGGRVKVSWDASNQDLPPFNRVTEYWVWRSVPESNPLMITSTNIVTLAALTHVTRPGTMLRTTVSGTDYYWELVSMRPAGHVSRYSYTAETTSDSLSTSNPYTAFMIQAWGHTPTQWWFSNVDSGYSVDNLAPGPPAPFAATYSGTTARLHWAPSSAVDFGSFRLYRGSAPDFVHAEGNLVASLPDTGFVDTAPQPQHYKLTAVDIHGNESAAVLVSPPSSVSVLPAGVGALWMSASPNPVATTAAVRFGLPVASRVAIVVTDLAGRRICSLVDREYPAGAHTVRWDLGAAVGRRVPNGIYLVSLRCGSQAKTSRIAVVN